MNFNKITIRSEANGTVIITPEKFYKIPERIACYVVIYNLKFIDSNPEMPEIESKIPYYISDGGTNKLRANMLYPFMCYSNINEIVNCPYDVNRYSSFTGNTPLLLKYSVFSIINIDKIEEDLLKTFLGIYPDIPDENSLLRRKIFDKMSRGNDLISVLERITNLLDFIICITNDVISNFNYVTESINITNGKYRPFSKEQTSIHDYTDLSIYGQETTYRINSFEYDNSSSSFNNHFRLVILTILNKYYKLFVDNNILNIETITLQPELITITMFNIIANICNKELVQANIINYKSVSKKLINIITENIDTIPTILEQDRLLLRSIILQTEKKQVNDDKLYNKLVDGWKAVCFSKRVNIKTNNVSEMNVIEICNELKEYYELIRLSDPVLAQEITRNCPDDTYQQNDGARLMILRDLLIKVRKIIISNYYIGQLYIKYIQPDHTEKIIIVDIDTYETIAQLKSKIFDIESIEPSRQRLSILSQTVFGRNLIQLADDRTIGSYKIRNYSDIRLVVE
jgi:hypothetical protein